ARAAPPGVRRAGADGARARGDPGALPDHRRGRHRRGAGDDPRGADGPPAAGRRRRAVAAGRDGAGRGAAPRRRSDRRAVEHRAARSRGHGNRAVSFAFWSVADTVRRVAAGEVTAAQIVETTLGRIASIDGQLGAYLAVDGTGARAAAADIDRRRAANQPLGPLAGATIALKDVLVT